MVSIDYTVGLRGHALLHTDPGLVELSRHQRDRLRKEHQGHKARLEVVPEGSVLKLGTFERRMVLDELIERERESRLSAEEAAELAHFLELEHILRMAKAKARVILANRS